MAFATDGKMGVSLTATVAGTGSSSDEGDQFKLGEVVSTQDGGEYMRVHAATAITQYDAVGVDENFEASAITKGMVDDGWMVGFAQIAASDNDFFWLAMKGANIQVRLAISCAADVPLYTTGTAGVLDDTSTSQTNIDGIVSVETITAATNAELIATHPRSTTF